MATKKNMERKTKHSKQAKRDAEYQRMVDAAAEGFRQVFRDFNAQPREVITPLAQVIVLPSAQCDCQCRNSRHRHATLKRAREIFLGLPSALAGKAGAHKSLYPASQVGHSSLDQMLSNTGFCKECSRVALLLRVGLTDERIVQAVLDRLYPLPNRMSCKKR